MFPAADGSTSHGAAYPSATATDVNCTLSITAYVLVVSMPILPWNNVGRMEAVALFATYPPAYVLPLRMKLLSFTRVTCQDPFGLVVPVAPETTTSIMPVGR